ncbi:hypothetical protein ACOSP7_018807 [Xanthoceras sorbifolium]
MLGDSQHVEEAEKIGPDYMDVKTLKDLQVWLAGGSPPPEAAKTSMRAARSFPSPLDWPCTCCSPPSLSYPGSSYLQPQAPRDASQSPYGASQSCVHIRANPCAEKSGLQNSKKRSKK